MTFTWEQKEFNTLGVSASHCVCVCYWSYSIVYIDEFGAGSPPNLGIYKVFFPFFPLSPISTVFISDASNEAMTPIDDSNNNMNGTHSPGKEMVRCGVCLCMCVLQTHTRARNSVGAWTILRFIAFECSTYNADVTRQRSYALPWSLCLPHCLSVGLSLWLFANIMCKYNAMQMDTKNNSIADICIRHH